MIISCIHISQILFSLVIRKVHEISARGLCAHILLYQMLTSGEYKQCLSDLLNSMMNRDKIPIYSHTERDKNLDDTDLLISKKI